MSIFLIKALQLIMALSILVLVHELGHFLFARLFKIRVNKFYLFFNPWFTLYKYKPKGSSTEYGIGWLPLGGYCQIAGMVDESLSTGELDQKPQEWEFRSKPAWQRFLVMFGGILFNLILAVIIYAGIAFSWGDVKIPMKHIGNNLTYSQIGHQMGLIDGDLPIAVDGKEFLYFDENILSSIVKGKELTILRESQGSQESLEIPIPSDLMQAIIASDSVFYRLNIPAVISRVTEQSEGERSGLLAGDKIKKVNEVWTNSLNDAITSLSNQRGDSVLLTIERSGDTFEVKTFIHQEAGIGILFANGEEYFKAERIHYSLLEAFPQGLHKASNRLSSYVSSLKYIATKEGASKLGGLGTIGKLFPQQFNWLEFWNLTAFLSVILAVMNVLPIPGLDGGHIMFILYEIIFRRKLPVKLQERILIVGMFFLIALMLYANLNDLFRFLF